MMNSKKNVLADEAKFVSHLFIGLGDGIVLAKLATKMDITITPDQVQGRAVFIKDRAMNINLFIKACRNHKIVCHFKADDIFKGKNIEGVFKTLHKVATFLYNERAHIPPFEKIP